MSPTQHSRVTGQGVWFAVLLLVLALAYSNHFHNSFHFDDSHAIVDNPAIRTLANLPRLLTDATAFSVLPANRTWRPVVSVSLAIDYWLGGGYNVVWFHISTFLLFIVQLGAMWFLYANIARRILPALSWTALAAMAWYGLHPAIAETVNYIIQRGDLYSTLGVVAGLGLYARGGVWRRGAIYLIPVALAVLAKPPALVFPALLWAYVFLFSYDADWSRAGKAVRDCLPAVVLCAFLGWLQTAMTPATYLPGIISPHDYRITQPFVWMRYFGSFFLPIHLNADSDLQVFSSMNTAAVSGFLFAAALVAGCTFTVAQKRLRPICFGLFWFLIGVLPTSLYALSEVENDHRMFFPFVGLSFAVSWALGLCVHRFLASTRSRSVAAALGALVLIVYAYGTWQRNKVWSTEESLWRDVTLKSPHNGRGLMNYGLTQMKKGDLRTALDYFTRASEFTPNYAYLEINLGIANGGLGYATAAEQHFQRALALAPDDAQTHYYYARWLAGQARSFEEREQLQTAVRLNPSWPEPGQMLAQLNARQEAPGGFRMSSPEDFLAASLQYHREGKYSESIAAAREALRLRPNYAEAYNNIAAAYEALGKWDDAIRAAAEAVRLKPDLQIARNNLAWALQQKQKSGAK